jgi:predicted O-linked N-acetylglucosamine transferase (SPINDLY family)
MRVARHLASLGAWQAAADLYLSVADASGRLPMPRRETPPIDYLRIAQMHAAAGHIDRALEMYEVVTRLAPDCHEAHWERGLILERRGEADLAVEAWRRSEVARDPHRHSLALVAAIKSPSSTNQDLFDAHTAWARHHAEPLLDLAAHPLPEWQPGDRVTIAYACSFWNTDTIRFQLLPLLRRHDRRRFKVIAYAQSEPGALVTAAVDEVHQVGALSNGDYVRRVREDGVHILVEVNGHSPGHWFAAMAARCAPVQVSYLNYTCTSGIDQVDYVLGDAIAIPEGTDRYFTEAVYRLPGCFFCFSYEDAVLPEVVPPPSVASGIVTFGCFGSGGKINPPLLDLWAEILRRTPDSRLLVRNGELTPADNRQALVRAFERRGIDRARLLILPGATRQGVLDNYADVDISLDTFPYCGGNTIAESLWQGVPVVTLKGDRFSSAYGASLLTASGLADLVADTPEAYVRKAVALAGDADRLGFYRMHLRAWVKVFGFGDADRFTADVETAYDDMLVRKYQPALSHGTHG